ncbi:MAG: hypothetical protein V3U81_00935, partial [Candidatus Binatia bacterium]
LFCAHALWNLIPSRSCRSENKGMKMSRHVTNSIYRRYDIIDEDDLKESMGKVQDYLSEQPKGAKVARIKKAG